MHLVTVGDLVLDVLVDAPRRLRRDDDTGARIELLPGGQAANVAAWAASLGAETTLIGPRSSDGAGSILAEAMAARGVQLAGLPVRRAGTVVSVVAAGERTLVSDGGDQSWVSRLTADRLPALTDWLHVSACPLLRSPTSWPVPELADVVRRQGGRVSLDLSSAAMIECYGVDRFRAEVGRLGPDLVFANEAEWELMGPAQACPSATLVLKRGPAGFSVVTATSRDDYPPVNGDVVDVTGAGDALAAGYLVGGVALALTTAARCISRVGAQPHQLASRSPSPPPDETKGELHQLR